MLGLCGFAHAGVVAQEARVSGAVFDPHGHPMSGVSVVVEATRVTEHRQIITDTSGHWEVSLPAGRYVMVVTAEGFEPQRIEVVVPPAGFVLQTIQLRVAVIVEPPVEVIPPRTPGNPDGSEGRTFTVNGDGPNSLDDLMLPTGRTTQSAECLTPTVVCGEQTGTGAEASGAGQRRDANDIRVDGVPANLQPDATGHMTGPGQNGVFAARGVDGSTKPAVPLAATEEITVRTAGIKPAHRHSSGIQTDVSTRSGADRLSGSWLIDRRLDGASDYFDRRAARPKREIDLTETSAAVGGPIIQRRLWHWTVVDAHALSRPVEVTTLVPSNATREHASPFLAQLYDVYAPPNGDDLGKGMAQRTDRYPADSRLWVGSSRLDWQITPNQRLFSRVTLSGSRGDEVDPVFLRPGLSYSLVGATSTSAVTFGLRSTHGANTVHQVRVHVGRHATTLDARPAHEGSALALDGWLPPDVSAEDWWIGISLPGADPAFFAWGRQGNSRQSQLFLSDAWSFVRRHHTINLSVETRSSITSSEPARHRLSYKLPSVLAPAGTPAIISIEDVEHTRVGYREVSAHLQDDWQVSLRVALFGGVRWSVKPAPDSLTEREPAVLDLNGQSRAAGLPLWRTSYADVSPMFGTKLKLGLTPHWETTLHATAGRVYDDISAPAAVAFRGPPFSTSRFIKSTLPVPPAQLVIGPATPGVPTEYVALGENLTRPHTDEAYVRVDQELGAHQSISAAYIYARGQNQLYAARHYWGELGERRGTGFTNDAWSRYHALAVQWRWQSSQLWASVHYTRNRARDNHSGESAGGWFGPSLPPPPSLIPADSYAGPSDYSRPHALDGTVSFRPSAARGPRIVRLLFSDMQYDLSCRTQSAAPVTVQVGHEMGAVVFDFRPDVVPGIPLWISDPVTPGERRLNPHAFRPTNEAQHGTHERNSIRGRSLSQVDAAVTRSLRIGGAALRLRIEAHNIFNLRNFAPPYTHNLRQPDGFPRFGEPFMSFAQGLGSGTLLGGPNPARQRGAPRTILMSIRFDF